VHPGVVVRRTTFHTLAMYATQLESRVGKCTIDTVSLKRNEQSLALTAKKVGVFHAKNFRKYTDQQIPTVDGIATVDESGKNWSIALINRDPSQSVACTVQLNEISLEGTFQATILAGDSAEAFNSIEHPDRVTPTARALDFADGVAQLPPHSLTILRIAPKDL